MAPVYYYFGQTNNPTTTRSWSYQQGCIVRPIASTAVASVIFGGLDVFQGLPPQRAFSPRNIGSYFVFLYTYHVVQCPMEFVHGRPSLWHNIIAGGTIGLVGVHHGRLGIPFVNPYQVAASGLSPPIVAFGVYGGIAGIFAGMIGNKRF
mmetsp:Transcript_20431/g.48556  ORF Transcript_20431/g.48556 Transcript_20431/m.48556 type:complete len:149 (+) Transcript_20431:81-527(+)